MQQYWQDVAETDVMETVLRHFELSNSAGSCDIYFFVFFSFKLIIINPGFPQALKICHSLFFLNW